MFYKLLICETCIYNYKPLRLIPTCTANIETVITSIKQRLPRWVKKQWENPWFDDESEAALYFNMEANLDISFYMMWEFPSVCEENPPLTWTLMHKYHDSA